MTMLMLVVNIISINSDGEDDNGEDGGADNDGNYDNGEEITVEAYRATCASPAPAMRTSMMSARGLFEKGEKTMLCDDQHYDDQVQ